MRFAGHRHGGLLLWIAFFMLLALCGRAVEAQTSAQAERQAIENGQIHGRVATVDNTPIAGAEVQLAEGGQWQATKFSAGADGSFAFAHLAPGSYTLTVLLQGFDAASVAVVLGAGETASLGAIKLRMTTVNVSVDVVASQQDVAEAQVHVEEQQRLIGIFPNFYVSYERDTVPLSKKEKFGLAWKDVIDPGNLLLVGTVAGVQQGIDAFPGYGHGAAGYGRRYGADLGNLVSGTFVSEAILPVLFHQDPRYFYQGSGSTRSRLVHALSSVVLCRGDNGHREAAFSTILGDMSAGAISNLYYASSDRKGASLTLTNGLLGIAGDALNDVFQEFFLRRLTRNADAHGDSSPNP